MTRRTTLWVAVALVGIAVSAALAWAASQLASQRVGLSSEPLSVAAGLAPPAAPRNPTTPDQNQDHRRHQAHSSRTPDIAPSATASTAAAAPSAPPPDTTSTPAVVGAPTSAPASAQPSAAGTQPSANRLPPAKPHDDSRGGGSGNSRQGPDD